MNCEILETLYIRSNGEVPCNDDAGEKVSLAQLPSDATFSAFFNNDRYTHIRDALKAGRVPWPDVCPGCAFYRPNEPFSDRLSKKSIRKIQVEPSLACRLRCPGCSGIAQMRSRRKPFQMDCDLFEATLRKLSVEGYSVEEIEYCGQGEPLLHPNFPEFVRAARRHYPAAIQRLVTSGNFDYQTSTAGERLDEIFVSCDGLFQESYAQYRVKGHVKSAIKFMKDAPQEIDGNPQKLIWKYILFEFNDGDAEIYLAQKMAFEMGVTFLLFVVTHSQFKSRRFTNDNSSKFPIYFPIVAMNATPIHYQISAPSVVAQ